MEFIANNIILFIALVVLVFLIINLETKSLFGKVQKLSCDELTKLLNNSKINDSSPDNGFLTLFTATCEANHQWFYHSSDKSVLTLKRSG